MLCRSLSLLAICLFLAVPVWGIEVVPLYTRNQSPLVQVFGLPLAEEGNLTPEGDVDSRLVLDIANIFTGDSDENETLRLDGEVYRLTLALRYGVSDRLELGLDIPYVWHNGGNFDGFIDGFHQTFDMPEGGREVWKTDYLRYVSVRNGETELYLGDDVSGLGDILLTAGWQLTRHPEPHPGGIALRGGIKLPTGDAEKLTGSESTDISLRLTGTDAESLSPWDLTWYWGAGGMWMSRGEVLSSRQRNAVAFGTLGIGWAPVSWGALKLQFDGHTPFYKDSDLVQLDSSSVQVIFGASLQLPGKFLFDFGVSEDLVVNTAPDAIFHFALRRRF